MRIPGGFVIRSAKLRFFGAPLPLVPRVLRRECSRDRLEIVPIVTRPNVRFLTLPCALILAPTLAAQDGIPQRPKLPKDADTNDAGEYVRWGNRRGTSWAKAYDAYY